MPLACGPGSWKGSCMFNRKIIDRLMAYEMAAAASDVPLFVGDIDAPTVRWSGVVGIEGEMTGDGRLIEANALRWDDDFPLPFRNAPEDIGAHGGAQIVGRIHSLERLSSGEIVATGDFDLDSEAGREAARQVQNGHGGVSMDLDDISFEVRLAKEVLEDLDSSESDEQEVDSEGRVTVMRMSSDDEVMVTTSARIRAVTMVAIPAFSRAKIQIDSGADVEEAIAASAGAPARVDISMESWVAPLTPPEAWFSDPQLSGPTPLQVTSDGRLYGHLAAWDTCHTAYADRCVTPPRSATAYAYFHTGALLTEEGSTVSVGVITMNTLHADRGFSANRTAAHYENTGAVAAHVVAGEDSHGIWIAGALSPSLSEEQVRTLRASPLSGDWRSVGGNLELIAALAVNVPGFPIPRPQGLVASGSMASLVASGMLAPERVKAPGTPGAFSPEDLRYLKGLIAKARDDERDEVVSRADELAARVARARVKGMARTLGLVE